MRADELLVCQGLVKNCIQAKQYILAAKVYAKDKLIQKPGTLLLKDTVLTIKKKRRFVSRGGEKLQGAIEHFHIQLKDKIVLDIGSSTGGFTDCVLQSGAKKVYAVDVGYGQLDYGLRMDKRVVCLERKNARYLTIDDVADLVDYVTIDASFISLKKLLPNLLKMLKSEGKIIALVKPQFEAKPELVSIGGVVREEKVRLEVVSELCKFAFSCGIGVKGEMISPLRGPAGNVEYFLYLEKLGQS